MRNKDTTPVRKNKKKICIKKKKLIISIVYVCFTVVTCPISILKGLLVGFLKWKITFFVVYLKTYKEMASCDCCSRLSSVVTSEFRVNPDNCQGHCRRYSRQMTNKQIKHHLTKYSLRSVPIYDELICQESCEPCKRKSIILKNLLELT